MKCQACALAEEDQLWACEVMGCSSPHPLQNAVFFYCGVYLCLRGGDKHC